MTNPSGVRVPTWVSVLLLLLVFGAGAVAGAGGAVLVIHKRLTARQAGPEQLAPRMAAELERRHDLDASQREAIRQILSRRGDSLDTIRDDAWTRAEGELDALREELAGVLGPDRAGPFRRSFGELRRNWRPPTRRR